MIDSKTRRALPAHFSIISTDWYNHIVTYIYNQKKNLLVFSYIIALSFPAMFTILDLSHGIMKNLINYLVPLLSLILILFYVLRKKCSPVMLHITMFVAFAGFFISAYLPNSRQVGVFIIVAFIPYAFHLTGLRNGAIWSGFFIVSVAGVYIAAKLHLIHEWNIALSGFHIFMLFAGLFVVGALLFSNQKIYDRLLELLVNRLVYDSSTELPNKETMMHSFPKDTPYMLAIVRIQNFGELSSMFGYETAEQILKFSARTLSSIAERDGFACYKLLGHEFGLIMRMHDKFMNRGSMQRLLDALWFEMHAAKSIDDNGDVFPLYRIGASLVGAGDDGLALSRSDVALTIANRTMRNTYLYDEMVDGKRMAEWSAQLYKVLLSNIRGEQFKAVFQPVVNTMTEETCWYEALLRVRRDDGSYESGYKYLPISRNTGLYRSVTRFMLKAAESMLQKLDMNISVNINMSDVADRESSEEILRLCEMLKERKGKLILEIVESEEIVDIELCRSFIDKVRALGCLVAIDDFGSGYSNFCNLIHLPIDMVKIDGLLMKSVESDEKAIYMIESITSFCHKTGKIIVAEFVENSKLHEIAKKYGIHYSQGYYFGKPDDILCD